MFGFFVGGHAFAGSGHHGEAVVFGEDVEVVVDEGPVESVPDGGPVFAFGVVGHFADVVRSGEIGFGGEESAVGKLGHAVDVGDHDPVVGVDEEFHEPAVNVVGVDATEEHEVAEDHEALDVVAIAGFVGALDGVVDGGDAGGAVVKGGGHLASEVPKVFGAHGDAVTVIHRFHEFTPTDDLANEAFEGVEGDVLFFPGFEGLLDDGFRREKAHVEHGGEDGVEHHAMLARERVFVGAELIETLGKESAQPFFSISVGDGVREGGEVEVAFAESILGPLDGIVDEGIGFGGWFVGDGVTFGEFFAVVFVEGILAAFGFVAVHENVHACALVFVETRHEGLLSFWELLVEKVVGAEEVGGRGNDELDPFFFCEALESPIDEIVGGFGEVDFLEFGEREFCQLVPGGGRVGGQVEKGDLMLLLFEEFLEGQEGGAVEDGLEGVKLGERLVLVGAVEERVFEEIDGPVLGEAGVVAKELVWENEGDFGRHGGSLARMGGFATGWISCAELNW